MALNAGNGLETGNQVIDTIEVHPRIGEMSLDEVPAFIDFFNQVTNYGAKVEQPMSDTPAFTTKPSMVDMASRSFTVTFWGAPGPRPDPVPNLMFTEVRKSGPRPTIWFAFTSTNFLIDAVNAPDCLIQYVRAKIGIFMRVYFKDAVGP